MLFKDFQAGQRVRVNRSCLISDWVGLEGTTADRRIGDPLDAIRVNFDDGSSFTLRPVSLDVVEPPAPTIGDSLRDFATNCEQQAASLSDAARNARALARFIDNMGADK